MSATDDQQRGEGELGGRSDVAKMAKRYGPVVVIVAVIAVVVAVFGAGGGDDDGDASSSDPASYQYEELVRSGPMTPIKAELLDEDFQHGPNCDPETERIMLPTVYAPPCIEPFDGDNGGATAQGVSEDAIKVVVYRPDPEVDPLGTGLIVGIGADVDPETAMATMEGYNDVFNEVFETYGRRVDVEFFEGTGTFDDAERARTDAIAIADREPFAVIGGPAQASLPFADELAERGIMSFPPQPLPESFLEERFPLVWGLTTPNQASRLAAEAIANVAGPGPATMAGDPDLQNEDRVYAIVHYDTPDGDHREAVEELRDGLAEGGIELVDELDYVLDFARMQDKARTMITRLKDRGVTTVIYYGDPLTPQALTAEATAQDYFPEWILGPSLLADSAIFARGYDPNQWTNGFGIAPAVTTSERKLVTAYVIYDWAFGEEPPSNIYASLEPSMRHFFSGVHLAGPELTIESFRDAMFRKPPSGGGPTRALVSWGSHGTWDNLDLGTNDDVAFIWWDPEVEGFEDESGNLGRGMYRFANGGQRYTAGNLPSSLEEAGIGNLETSIVKHEELPEEDSAPDYPPPDLG